MTNPYQQCRWYDLHPQLGFALRMLSVAPKGVQEAIFEDLLVFLQFPTSSDTLGIASPDTINKSGQISHHHSGHFLNHPPTNPNRPNSNRSFRGNRWYDRSLNGQQVLLLLKTTAKNKASESFQQLIAKRICTQLHQKMRLATPTNGG